MLNKKRRTKITNIDPLAGITISSSGFDPKTGGPFTVGSMTYSLDEAIARGEERDEKGIGFSIGGHHVHWNNQRTPLQQVAWEVMAVATEFARVSRTSRVEAMVILGTYLDLSQVRGVRPVGLLPASEIAKGALDAYQGKFESPDAFLSHLGLEDDEQVRATIGHGTQKHSYAPSGHCFTMD